MRIIPPASSVTAVSTRLFIGSLADAERLAKDNPHQVQTVITLCERPIKHRDSGIRYLHFPVRDAHPIPIALLNAILEAIYQSVSEGAVLVHCHFGLSRAPTLVAAFLDQTGSARFEDAIRTLRKLRPHDLRHHAITRMLENGVDGELVNAISGHVSKRMHILALSLHNWEFHASIAIVVSDLVSLQIKRQESNAAGNLVANFYKVIHRESLLLR